MAQVRVNRPVAEWPKCRDRAGIDRVGALTEMDQHADDPLDQPQVRFDGGGGLYRGRRHGGMSGVTSRLCGMRLGSHTGSFRSQ